MKLAIIGCNGQLGHDMVSVCEAEKHDVYAIDYPEIDITNHESTETALKRIAPDVIINCAAYTAVDDCEKNQKIAFAVNAQGVANIAQSAKSINARIVHISTDYVFDGMKTSAYIESDETNPQSVYGKSKLEGEKYLSQITNEYYIFRIAWLYGKHGSNFVKTIHKRALIKQKEQKPLKVVNDQFGTPTYTIDICKQILPITFTDRFGLYHCTNEGECSWFDFACHIVQSFNINIDILPCSTSEFPKPAPRPSYSVLENNNLKLMGIHIMPQWKNAYSRFLKEITDNELYNSGNIS